MGGFYFRASEDWLSNLLLKICKDEKNHMKRREFLKAGILGGAAALASPLMADDQTPEQAVKPFDLDEVTIADLQRAMASGKETARSITQKYLTRIDEIDRNGPTMRSVIETNTEALAHADRLDKLRADGVI